MIKEFKKELSRLAGIDFFNPKFRDIFKRYLPDDADKEEETTAEEERLREVVGEEQVENIEKELASENLNESAEEENTEDVQNTDEEAKTEENVDETVQDEESADDKENAESDGDNSTDESLNAEPASEAEPKQEANQELVDTKVELELVKAGVREDRLEPAKRLILSEIHGLEDLDKVKEMIKQFPEWIKENAVNTKPFGMPVGEGGGDLTEEEKRLKAMGIDPRS